MQYDLKKYERAFDFFADGGSWKSRVKPITRQAMIFVALNTDFEDNSNKNQIDNMFGSNSGFQYDTNNTLTVLREIKKIEG